MRIPADSKRSPDLGPTGANPDRPAPLPARISNVEVAIFLRALLRHLRGHVIVLLDSGSIHKGPDVQTLEAQCPRLHLEWFPGYAPELNPDEWVWAHFKAQLANGHPDSLDDLMTSLCRITKNVNKRPDLIRSFITGSDLPSFLCS